MNVSNRVAVITGAGSGIGRATALALARRGCHLGLADIDPAGLKETAWMLSTLGVRVTSHPLDVADREAVRALPAAVMDAHKRVDLLVNNAGVALGGSFEQVDEDDFDWLMDINFNGVVRMTRGFSNALRHELEGSTVAVSVVHPGGVATAIARNARVPRAAPPEDIARGRKLSEKLLRMPPATAGEIIARGIERRQARILVGNDDARFVSLLKRLAPVNYWRL
jgi:NADP-dependent 3-hydroxy acid dehydrogenase YdfG